jgi:hypothetical protein
MMRAALAIIALALCAGCSTRRGEAPRATSQAGAASVGQSGDAATPATATATSSTVEATIPPGVQVTAHPDGAITWRTVAPLTITTTRTNDRATGPASFTPPAPPTPADEARGFGVRAFYLAAIACVLAAAFCVWRAYPLAAICFGAAAIALPVLATFFSTMSATVAGVGFVCIALGLVTAYLLTKKRPISVSAS